MTIHKVKMAKTIDRQSGIQSKMPDFLTLVPDIKHLSPAVLKRVHDAIISARRAIEGVIADENGQLELFPNLNEEAKMPADQADEIIEQAQAELEEIGVRLKKSGDLIRVVADIKDEEAPHKAIGY